MGTKVCSKCNKLKSLLSFGNLKASKDGKSYQCKGCFKIENNVSFRKEVTQRKERLRLLNLKVCSSCNKEKDVSQFYKRANVKCGLRSNCIECGKKAVKDAYEANPDKHREYAKRYRKQNREVVLGRTKIWRSKNKKHIADYGREYFLKNKEKIYLNQKNRYPKYRKARIENAKKWGQENPGKVKAIAKIYRENNKEKISDRSRRNGAKSVKNLSDTYICNKIQRKIKFSTADLKQYLPQLIEIKRLTIKSKRLAKQK